MRNHALALVVVVMGLSCVESRGDVALLPAPMRLAGADVMVVGRVIGFHAKDIEAQPFPGFQKGRKFRYRLALVKVSDGLRGAKANAVIKVGYMVQAGNPAIISSRPGVQLKIGQEGLFYLDRHFSGDFYVLPMLFQRFYPKNNKSFASELKLAKVGALAMEQPVQALSAKNADDRLLAASVLIFRYRVVRRDRKNLQPIPAKESELILEALAETDWKKKRKSYDDPNPTQLFLMLRPTKNDGWVQPADTTQLPDAAKMWLRKNAKSFRIQRYVK